MVGQALGRQPQHPGLFCGKVGHGEGLRSGREKVLIKWWGTATPHIFG